MGILVLAVMVTLNLLSVAWFVLQFARRTTAAGGESAAPLPGPVMQIIGAIAPLVPVPEMVVQDEPPPAVATGVVNILILGIDQRFDQEGDPTRSDVVMVLRLDFDHKQAKLLSFPRDLWLPIPDVEDHNIAEGRINQAYFYGELFNLQGGGPALAEKTVELNFGIPIDSYVLVTFDGFEKIVDALGGIDIDVPEPIYDPLYPTDDYGTMVLEIEPGWQHMDGEQALRYARTRHQDSDTKRVVRQQLVLMAIRDKALNLNVLANWRELYEATRDAFETDIPLSEMVAFAVAGHAIGTEDIHTYAIGQNELIPWTTPGGAHVWIPRRALIGEIITRFMAVEPSGTAAAKSSQGAGEPSPSPR